jgi:hypothetical protein
MKYAVALNMRRPVRFDHVAALLVGTLAVLGAVLISLQLTHDHASGRAGSQGSRLALDITTRGAVSNEVVGWTLSAQQQAITIAMSGLGRSLAAVTANSSDDSVVGDADFNAGKQLQAEIAAMSATAGQGLDPYTAGLVTASIEQTKAELAEQIHQIDLADAEGSRSHIAVLGLTFTALGGVLAGLAVALKETRPGWGILILGCVVALAAIGAAILAF